jgi:hypothetical protein
MEPSFKRFLVIMAIIITALLVINIKISGVGASTISVTGQTQIAQLNTDVHNVNKTISKPASLGFDVACQQLYSASVLAQQASQIPSKLKNDWTSMTSALNSAGSNCIHGEVYEHSTGGVAKATSYINSAKLYLVTGNKLLVKLTKQMK